jgi:hypothetical protein
MGNSNPSQITDTLFMTLQTYVANHRVSRPERLVVEENKKPNRISKAPSERHFNTYHVDGWSPTESRLRFLSAYHSQKLLYILEHLEERERRVSRGTMSIVGMEYWNG